MSVLATLPGSLPTQPIPADTNAPSVAKTFAPFLNGLKPKHFVDDAIWRDHFALTGSLRSFYSSNSIITAWQETSSQRSIGPIMLDSASATVIRHPTGPAWINCKFSFEGQHPLKTSCIGFVSLVPVDDNSGQWKIWVLRTILQNLDGQPDVDQLQPAGGLEDLDASATFDCVVIGGGPAGLAMAGRLKAMGLSYVLIDKNTSIGDNWKNRYESVRRKNTADLRSLGEHSADLCSAYPSRIWYESLILPKSWRSEYLTILKPTCPSKRTSTPATKNF